MKILLALLVLVFSNVDIVKDIPNGKEKQNEYKRLISKSLIKPSNNSVHVLDPYNLLNTLYKVTEFLLKNKGEKIKDLIYDGKLEKGDINFFIKKLQALERILKDTNAGSLEQYIRIDKDKIPSSMGDFDFNRVFVRSVIKFFTKFDEKQGYSLEKNKDLKKRLEKLSDSEEFKELKEFVVVFPDARINESYNYTPIRIVDICLYCLMFNLENIKKFSMGEQDHDQN